MAGMKISVDAAMRARDVSRPQDEAADAPPGGQGVNQASAAGSQASRGQPSRGQPSRDETGSSKQTGAGPTGAGPTPAIQTGADEASAHQASTNRASRPLPATQFRPKKRSRRRGR